ncbi:MAG: hypothetical protein RL648_1303 [Verrucomicrobiota bacterium]
MKHPPPNPPFARLLLILGLVVVLIFSAAVLFGMSIVRSEVRHKMLQRDAALLQRVAQYLYDSPEESDLADWDIVDLALDSSEIDGIVGVRVFRPLDTLIEQVPDTLYPVRLAPEDTRRLQNGQPVIRYFEAYLLGALFMDGNGVQASEDAPLLEIVIPLVNRRHEPVASIQYWIDGTSLKAEFAQMDRHLLLWSIGFIFGGGSIFGIVFLVARSRLTAMASLLATRNVALQQANRDLALAAKTSAIGAVASHLFHGLKNPLAGLKAYLKLTQGDAEAMEVANRMQGLIDETLAVLKTSDGEGNGTFSMEEAIGHLRHKLDATGNSPVLISSKATGQLSGYRLQLLQLILRNLVDNALQAKPLDNRVEILFETVEDHLVVTLRDHGPGLPKHILPHLFEPVTSDKSGGNGIGLAISAVLARHLPGSLTLLDTSPQGTAFKIHIAP